MFPGNVNMQKCIKTENPWKYSGSIAFFAAA
jgi:hypothetical protein